MDKNKPFANLYYFRVISRIGGTEQFLYELAKKYHQYDITILYDEADFEQLMRLKRLVRCVHRQQGQKYYTKKAFYNFNIDAIEQVEADEHIFVCHAVYQELQYEPPIDHPKITAILAVSKYAEERIALQERVMNVDKPIIQCYNPLTLEKPDRVLRIVSACRLEDKTKGGERTMALVEALDRYCEKTGRHYLWTIFTNTAPDYISSPNVAIMKPRIDVRPYIADSDWLVQVSNNMETYCYSVNEALGYGVGVVRTPLSVAKELKIPKQAELVLGWDCGNVDKIAEQMFEPRQEFAYKPPKDGWRRLLVTKPSDYRFDDNGVLIRAIKPYYDMELQHMVSSWSEPWRVSEERARNLIRQKLVRVI